VTAARYRDAGVDIEAGEEAVRRIRDAVRSTFGPHVATDVGAFAGAVTVPGGDPDTHLVASMDGVGTKLKVAAAAGRYDTVGRDLVNHCVGDIGVHGAAPLFFLDYVGAGKLDPRVVESVVSGVAAACRENGCALLGGETAEMPGVYSGTDFDLVGCIVGMVKRSEFVTGADIAPGDVLLGFPSTGLHTNGFSLARKVLLEDDGVSLHDPVPGTRTSVGDALLAVHRSYLGPLTALKGVMKGAAHITGGGIVGNLARILPAGTEARVDLGAWRTPPVFRLIAERGNVPADDLYRTFNMGIGLIAVVPADRADEAAGRVEDGIRVGSVLAGDGSVHLEGETRW
jgi:phosphoribosylformylglycinamidine cyclo-ligase